MATALGIGPRTRSYVLRDQHGFAYDGQRYEMVLAALSRNDITPELSARVHTVAYALRKSMTSARMPATSVLRIAAYSAYQVCALVARIDRECPEETVGGICDGWIAANHGSL
jgi:hypothetical protein